MGFRPGRDARCKRARRGLAREGKRTRGGCLPCLVACFCLCWGRSKSGVAARSKARPRETGNSLPRTYGDVEDYGGEGRGRANEATPELRWLCCAARPAEVAGIRLLAAAAAAARVGVEFADHEGHSSICPSVPPVLPRLPWQWLRPLLARRGTDGRPKLMSQPATTRSMRVRSAACMPCMRRRPSVSVR